VRDSFEASFVWVVLDGGSDVALNLIVSKNFSNGLIESSNDSFSTNSSSLPVEEG